VPALGIAPELVLLSLALITIALAVTLRGVRVMWIYSFGSVLVSLAGILNYDKWIVHIHFGGPLLALNNRIQNAILDAAQAFDAQAGRFWHGAATLATWLAKETERVARSQLAFGEWLVHVHIPKWVKAVVSAAIYAYPFEKLVRALLRGEIGKLTHETRVVVHDATRVIEHYGPIPYAADWRWLHRHWKALTAAVLTVATLPATLPHVGVDVGKTWRGLTRRLARLERRMTRVEALLGVTAFAAVMAKVLGVSARCLKGGGPLSRVSRALCGLSGAALADLLGLLVDAFVFADLCLVLRLLDDAVPYALGPVNDAIDAFDMALSPCKWEKPPTLHTPQLVTPTSPGFQLSTV
jgi:hypothetical protein